MAELTLLDCRLPGREGRYDVALADGRVAAISAARAPASPVASAANASMPLGGMLLLPALADGHIHLDKTFVGAPWRPHRPGDTIAARIAAEREERARVPLSVEARASRLIERAIGLGVLAMRSHVDIDEDVGLAHAEALIALREAWHDRVDIQLVAFPQGGTGGRVPELLDAALRLGVDAVGGLDPAGIDGDIEAHLDLVFGLAERHGARIDIHLHDPGTLGGFELRRIAARTVAAGFNGRVAVSHAFALGMLDAAELGRTARDLAHAGVAIMSSGPGADAMPPLRALHEAGVLLFGGSDNIRDAWSPYGDGDLLRRAGLIGYRADYRGDAELERAFAMVSANSRAALGLEPVTLEPGSRADLIALPVESIAEAVADPPRERLVFRAGWPVDTRR